jgi:creatinine amidohydrolase
VESEIIHLKEPQAMSDQRQLPDALNRRVFLSAAAAGGMAAAGGAAALAAAAEKPAAKDVSLQWLNITSERMPQAVKDVQGVCLVPWGCIERHGPHLPVGADTIQADAIATRASQIEPAVVFPALYFGQIAEARQCPGTISLDHDLLLRLLQATLNEISRNGFTKIVIVNHHGGNSSLLSYLLMSMLQERRPYVVYSARVGLSAVDRSLWTQMSPGRDGHAGPLETSLLLHLRPETVHLEDLRDPSDGEARSHLKNLDGIGNSFSWYANYPTHLGGDPRSGAAEKGAFWLESAAKELARQIKKVKEDDVSAALAKEFYDAAERPLKPPR